VTGLVRFERVRLLAARLIVREAHVESQRVFAHLGGSDVNGGAFEVASDMTVAGGSRVHITEAKACNGGGVYTGGSLLITEGSLMEVVDATAFFGYGGGCFVNGSLTVTSGSQLAVTGGSALAGGGIYVRNRLLVANHSQMSCEWSQAVSSGGGISADIVEVVNGSELNVTLSQARLGAGVVSNATRISSSRLLLSELSGAGGPALAGACLHADAGSLVELREACTGSECMAFADDMPGTSSCSGLDAFRVDGGARLLLAGLMYRRGAIRLSRSSSEVLIMARDKDSWGRQVPLGTEAVELSDVRLQLLGASSAASVAAATSMSAQLRLLQGTPEIQPLLRWRPTETVHLRRSFEEEETFAGHTGMGAPLKVENLTVLCSDWPTGCEYRFVQGGSGFSVYLDPGPSDYAKCENFAQASSGFTSLCDCAQGWHAVGHRKLVLDQKLSKADKYCRSCQENEHYLGGACEPCPWASPWSPGTQGLQPPHCTSWPIFQAGLLWKLNATAAVFVSCAILVFLLLKAPLHVVDMRLTGIKDSPGCSPKLSSASTSTLQRPLGVLVVSVQSWTNMLLPRVRQVLFNLVKYRVEGTGADLIDFDSKRRNLFSLLVRGECRVQLCGAHMDVDRVASKGMLVPVQWRRAYCLCFGILSVLFGLPVFLIGCGSSVTRSQLLLGMPLTFVTMCLAWLLVIWMPLACCTTRLLALYEKTPLMQAHCDYRRKVHPTRSDGHVADHPHHCGVTAGVLWDLLEHYGAFILDRNMHYVVSNIVLPLTEPSKSSFAAIWGRQTVTHFVSHSWCTPFFEFVETLRRHAESIAGARWRSQTYWVCSFSNNQWDIASALGDSIASSAFARVLRGGVVRDMVMVLDAKVRPLQRVWCLYELWIATQQKFHVTFATSMGIIGDATCASVDIVFAIAERIGGLQVEDCEASNGEDKRQILASIVDDLGSLSRMDTHIRRIMAKAIGDVARHVHARSVGIITQLSNQPSPVTSPAEGPAGGPCGGSGKAAGLSILSVDMPFCIPEEPESVAELGLLAIEAPLQPSASEEATADYVQPPPAHSDQDDEVEAIEAEAGEADEEQQETNV